MNDAGFYQQKKMSPGAVAIVVLLHGAAITAVAVAREGLPDRFKPVTTTVDFIEPKPDPAPKPPPPQPERPQQEQVLTHVAPLVKIPDLPTPALPPMPQQPVIQSLTSTQVVVAQPPGPPLPLPPPPPAKSQSARAKANLGTYVSDADYPPDAVRREEQGTTRFRLAVGPDGRVADCTVTGSSGSASLDLATCRLMKSRARFAPARDTGGNAVADSVTNAINWRLPSG
jgi:protein TonB